MAALPLELTAMHWPCSTSSATSWLVTASVRPGVEAQVDQLFSSPGLVLQRRDRPKRSKCLAGRYVARPFSLVLLPRSPVAAVIQALGQGGCQRLPLSLQNWLTLD